MRRILIPMISGILFLTLQTTLFSIFPIHRMKPDLVLILTLFLGISSPPLSGGMLVFFLGYLTDLFSGNSFGLYAFSRLFLFNSAQLLKDRIYLESYFSRALFVFLFTLTEAILVVVLVKAFYPELSRSLSPFFLTGLFPQSFSTAFFAPVLFSIFKKGYSLLSAQPRMVLGDKG